MMKRFTQLIAVAAVFAVAGVAHAAPFTWQEGWNDMGTISGGSLSFNHNPATGALRSVGVSQAAIDWDGIYPGDPNNLDNFWSNIFGDQGQYFFDGTIRNSWYDGSVDLLEAYDWGPGSIQTGDNFEWLVNNYARDGSGNPTGVPRNSHIRGIDSSFTYDDSTGEFEAILDSNGTWYWYTPTTPDSPMSGWRDGDLAMTGRFRITGTFAENDGNIEITSGLFQHELAVVPVPPAAGLILLGMAGIGLRRKFAKK